MGMGVTSGVRKRTRRRKRKEEEEQEGTGRRGQGRRGRWPLPIGGFGHFLKGALATSYDFWGTQREGAMPNEALANAFVFDDGCQDVGGEGGGERRRRKVYSKLTQEEAEG